ncbi:MAG: DUF5683 domain-containing protein [Chitinophagales bacterium]
MKAIVLFASIFGFVVAGAQNAPGDSTMTGPIYTPLPVVTDSAAKAIEKKQSKFEDSSIPSSLGSKDSGLAVVDTAAKDSTQTIPPRKLKRHSAGRAAWMSAVLPGLGQAYNRKYWKIPIVYGGFAGLGYAVYYTASNFTAARNAYRDAVDGNPATQRTYRGISSSAELKAYRDYYNRYLNIASIFTAVWYALNIVDAAVDGHLFHYNMNDKLSMELQPQAPAAVANTNVASTTFGLQLTLNW